MPGANPGVRGTTASQRFALLSRDYAARGERARPGRSGWRPRQQPLGRPNGLPFSDAADLEATRRWRRVATPGAGVLPISFSFAFPARWGTLRA